jgi:hypothetical protein
MDATTDNFPPTSPPLPDDYSDVASAQSGDEGTERRRYQRGGRKKKTTKSRIPPVPESQIATEPEHREAFTMDDEQIAAVPEHKEEVKLEEEERLSNGTAHEKPDAVSKEAPRGVETSNGTCPECTARKQTAEQKKPTPFETGIRAFNLKRAASSGGRPVGVRATTESKKSRKKSAKKKKNRAKAEVKEEGSDEEDSSEEDEEEEEEEPQSKPMSIRLDLNLVVEIFLKAKIQGDVTITFL